MQAESSFSISPHWAPHRTDNNLQRFSFCTCVLSFETLSTEGGNLELLLCYMSSHEATSVGGWAGGVSICLKSQCIFYLMIFDAKTYIFPKQLQNPFVSSKVKKKKSSSAWQQIVVHTNDKKCLGLDLLITSNVDSNTNQFTRPRYAGLLLLNQQRSLPLKMQGSICLLGSGN